MAKTPSHRRAGRLALLGGAVFCSVVGFDASAQQTMPFNCTLKPLQEVVLSAPTSGVIRSVLVSAGQRVEAGDLIVQLDDRLVQAERDVILAQLAATSGLRGAQQREEVLEARVARLQRGFNQNAVSAADLELGRLELVDAQNTVAVETERMQLLEAELRRTEVTIELFKVHSPVSGVMGQDLAEPGETVSQVPVGTIYVNQPLRVEAFVPSRQLAEFMDRDTYTARINGAEIDGTLEFDYRSEIADLASNTVSVYFRLNAPDVLPGSQCEIF